MSRNLCPGLYVAHWPTEYWCVCNPITKGRDTDEAQAAGLCTISLQTGGSIPWPTLTLWNCGSRGPVCIRPFVHWLVVWQVTMN